MQAGGPSGAEQGREIKGSLSTVDASAPDKKHIRAPRTGFLHFIDRLKERSPLPARAPWKDVLIRAKHARNHEIPDDVDEIDLDTLGQDLEEMAKMTIYDPTHREVGKLIRVGRRLVGPTRVTKEPTARYGREMTFTADAAETYAEDNRRLGRPMVILHTHPVDIIQSPDDIYGLLISPREPNAQLASMIETVSGGTSPGRKILVFRGTNAVSLTHDEANKLISEWNYEVRMLSRQYNPATATDQASERFDKIIQHRVFLRRAQELGLKIFIAGPGEHIARLQKPQSKGIQSKALQQ